MACRLFCNTVFAQNLIEIAKASIIAGIEQFENGEGGADSLFALGEVIQTWLP